jgi:hypothetical protein
MLPKKGKELHHAPSCDTLLVDFTKLVATALRTELGTTHQAVKTVMRWTGASERTVKHWLAGTHGPSAQHLVALARHSDEVLELFLVLAERNSRIVTAKLFNLRRRLLETVEFIDQQI